MIVKLANLIAIRRDAVDNRLSPDDISLMFNEFLVEFERMEKSGITKANIFYDAVEEIIDAVLSIAPSKVLDARLLYHSLLHFLHQLLISILDKWCTSPLRINIQEMDIFLKIILIFVRVAEQLPRSKTEEDRQRIKDLLTTKHFLFKVREQIDEIILNKSHLPDDRNIYALGLLTIKLLHGCPFYYRLGRNERLIDDLVISSLDSYDFIQVMRQLQSGQLLTRIEHQLLFTCWQYLSPKSSATHKLSTQITSIDLIHYLSDELLIRLEHALDEPPPPGPRVLTYLLERYYRLLNVHNLPSFHKHAHFIVDHIAKRLQKLPSTNTTHDTLVTVLLEAFYNLTKNSDIRSIIKQRHLTSLFSHYASAHTDHATRQLALNILAQTIDEQDVNKNPHELTTIFLQQLKQLHSNEQHPHIDSALSNLNVLMQHEQIKAEFVRQGGVNTLTSFLRDGNPNKQSPQHLEDALRILWLCTFNNPQALHILQQDSKLMDRVHQLLHNADHTDNSSLKKAAEGLIWKVEKEEAFKQQQEEKHKAQPDDGEDEQYDCMISYSWADMDLAHRIFHHLTAKLGYKVWLDQEQMHGSTIEAMANAVENAQFILMCMSDTYKQSASCQSEVEYAFKRKKHIIPIKMKEGYTADGWLGFIVGTRMYIDFGKYDFEKAMVLLDNEIQLQKKKRKETGELTKARKQNGIDDQYNEDAEMKGYDDSDEIEDKMDLKNILDWDETVVRNFLRKKDLSDFIPLCAGMNGAELLDLYGMCKSSSTTMYRSLKFELLNMHEKVLPISTFLHFIRRLRVVDDSDLPLNLYIYSEHLTEHSQDDE